MLKRFDLIKYAHQRVDSLSGGNKRKLCAAISVMAPVSIVLMDEPTRLIVILYFQFYNFEKRQKWIFSLAVEWIQRPRNWFHMLFVMWQEIRVQWLWHRTVLWNVRNFVQELEFWRKRVSDVLAVLNIWNTGDFNLYNFFFSLRFNFFVYLYLSEQLRNLLSHIHFIVVKKKYCFEDKNSHKNDKIVHQVTFIFFSKNHKENFYLLIFLIGRNYFVFCSFDESILRKEEEILLLISEKSVNYLVDIKLAP